MTTPVNILDTAIRIKQDQTESVNSPAGPIVWMLAPDSSNRRVRTICGHALGSDFVCAAESGAGTSHPNIGECIEHEAPFIPRLVDAVSTEHIPQHLVDIFERQAKSDVRLMTTIDPEIQGLYGLLEMQFRNLPADPTIMPTAQQIQAIRTNFQAIAGMKKDRRVMEDKMTLDMSIVVDFIQRIMAVVMENSNELQARRIFHEIMNQVVKPMRAEGRISGASALLTGFDGTSGTGTEVS